MRVSIIVAVAKHRVIGKENKLPWHLPEDLKHFKELTMGHPVLMGRKTYESIGKPLEGRTNIVVTKNHEYQAAGCLVAASLSHALSIASESPGSNEVFVIGGAEVYRQALLFADRMYVTEIDLMVDGDKYFPAVRWREWQEVSRVDHPAIKDSPHYAFIVFKKIESR